MTNTRSFSASLLASGPGVAMARDLPVPIRHEGGPNPIVARGGTAVESPPGLSWERDGLPTGDIAVNAATSGHAFTAIRW